MAEKDSLERKRLIGLRPLLRRLAPYRLQALGALFAMAVAAGMVLAFGQGLKYLIDEGFRTNDPRLLDRAVLVVFASTVVLALASFSRFYMVSWIGERVVADLRKEVFGHLLTLSPGFFEVTRTGDVISRLTTDTAVLQTVVGASLPFAMRNALMFLGGAVLLFVTSPQLAGIAAVVVPLVVVPTVVFGRRVRRLARAMHRQVAETAAGANETLHGIRTIQAFTYESISAAQFGGHVEAAFTAARKWIRARASMTAVVILLVFASISVVLWTGGHDVLAGSMTPGQLRCPRRGRRGRGDGRPAAGGRRHGPADGAAGDPASYPSARPAEAPSGAREGGRHLPLRGLLLSYPAGPARHRGLRSVGGAGREACPCRALGRGQDHGLPDAAAVL